MNSDLVSTLTVKQSVILIREDINTLHVHMGLAVAIILFVIFVSVLYLRHHILQSRAGAKSLISSAQNAILSRVDSVLVYLAKGIGRDEQ